MNLGILSVLFFAIFQVSKIVLMQMANKYLLFKWIHLFSSVYSNMLFHLLDGLSSYPLHIHTLTDDSYIFLNSQLICHFLQVAPYYFLQKGWPDFPSLGWISPVYSQSTYHTLLQLPIYLFYSSVDCKLQGTGVLDSCVSLNLMLPPTRS